METEKLTNKVDMFYVGQKVVVIDEDSDYEGLYGEVVEVQWPTIWVKLRNRTCHIPFDYHSLSILEEIRLDWE